MDMLYKFPSGVFTLSLLTIFANGYNLVLTILQGFAFSAPW